MELKEENNNMEKSDCPVKITYFGGVWPTNIGNSFIDLGSIQSLRMANPNSTIYFSSEMSKWFYFSRKKDIKKALELASIISSDYAVFSGMMLCDEFIKLYEYTVSELVKRGVKIIINGGGGSNYTEGEINNIRRFFEKYPPYAFISRDEISFENFCDLAERSYNGIDCGFFLSDYFIPAKLNLPDFIVFNFDESKIVKLIDLWRLKKYKSMISLLFAPKIQIPQIQNELIIRTHHSCWPKIPREHFIEFDTLISDIPDDYLHLYANTKATYSDRVHACIATLSFGNPAKLYSQTKRALLFDKVGAAAIREKLTYPDIEKMHQEKLKQLKILKSIII